MIAASTGTVSMSRMTHKDICLTGQYMGRPKWVEISKHLKLNGKSLKQFRFRVRTLLKSSKSNLFGSTRLSLPV